MEHFKVGDFVNIPLRTREELGLVIEVDDCDGKYKSNPWVVINVPNGTKHATAATHTAGGVRKLPPRYHY